MKYIVKEFIKIVIIVAIAIPVINIIAAATSWTGPTEAPPGGNADAPINVGSVMQTKLGLLNVRYFNSFFDTFLATVGGNVGIGTVSPNTSAPNGEEGNLDVNDIWVRGANAGAGQWVSQMGGSGGTCPPPRQLVLIGAQVLCLEEGITISCGGNWTGGAARYKEGVIQARVYRRSGPNCDSEWVTGFSASCNACKTGHCLKMTNTLNSGGMSVDESGGGGETGFPKGFVCSAQWP